MDWGLDRAVDAIPAIDEGGTGAQTSGVLQMLLDPGCDRCDHGDCTEPGLADRHVLAMLAVSYPYFALHQALCPDATGFTPKVYLY